MTEQRRQTGSRTADRAAATTRRRLLAGVGASAAAALAGCSAVDGDFGSEPSFERRSVDADGEGRSAQEMTAAAALAQRSADRNLTQLNDLSVEAHEFVLEDGFLGATVQGRLRNTAEKRLQTVEVRVRALDDRDRHLGRYLASTGDLAAGATWSFQVVLLESPGDVAAYDIGAFGMSA